MKKRVKSILLVLFSVMASLFLFVGCELGETLEDALANRNLKVSVTYYGNGGTFAVNSGKVLTLYYEEDNLPLNINAGGSRENYETGGATISGISSKQAIVRRYYEFLGWYHAEKDENGEYLKEEIMSEDGKTVESVIYFATEEAVDFTQALSKGDYVFVAKWREIPKLVVQLVCDTSDVEMTVEGICDEMKEKTSIKHGDMVRTFRFDDDGKTDSIDISVAPFTADGYTLINYYHDEDCTQPLSGVFTRGDTMTEDKTVYLRVATGEWTVVRTANDFNKINWGSNTVKYWIANDINASSLSSKVPPSKVACEVQGNGFKVSGMNYKRGEIGKSDKVSLFGEIQTTAKIENLTFEDLKIVYDIKFVPNENDGGSIKTVFTLLTDGATITNVCLTGTMTISKASNAGDLDKDAIRCFGGYATDEDYMTQTNGQGFVSEIEIK